LSLIDRLKKRWNLNSTTQVLVVLLVFACTGTSVVLLRRWLVGNFEWANSRWFTYSYYWLILPFYNLMLLGWGFIFGQFAFFWEFEKRFFNRIVSYFRKNKQT